MRRFLGWEWGDPLAIIIAGGLLLANTTIGAIALALGKPLGLLNLSVAALILYVHWRFA